MKRKHQIPSQIIVLMQILSYLLLVGPLRLYYRARRRLPENLTDLSNGALIVSNHQSRVDPLLVLASIPFWTFLRIVPVRFPVADIYYYSNKYNPAFFPVMSLCGCFPVGVTGDERMKTMFLVRDLLNKGVTILIFPEGKIVKDKTVADLQQGINFFAKNASQIVFVRIRGLNSDHKDSDKRVNKVVFSDVMFKMPAFEAVELRQYLEELG